MARSSTAGSRRERPAKKALTLEGIVAAALAITETEDFERLTMRRLAAALDTGPASLYVYVRNTAELHAYVLDELLGTLDLSWDPARTPWQERLSALLSSYLDLLMRHPGLARSTVVYRPSGANYLDLVETALLLLSSGGVPPERAAWGVDVLLQVPTAIAAELSTRGHTPAGDDEERAQAAAVLNATERHPLIAALGEELLSGSPTARRDWVFDVVVNGILATPRPPSEAADPPTS